MDVEALEERFNDKRYMGKIFPLSDGRKLSYSEVGQLENGHPVLFHVGLMCSSLAIVNFHDEALRLNLHIVTIDYPGIGESSPQPNRDFSDWANNVQEFVMFRWGPTQSLSLLSHCMGAPHALAVMAHPTLSQRISCVTLVSPWLLLSSSSPEQPLTQSWVHHAVCNSVLPSIATSMVSSGVSMTSSIPMSSLSSSSSQSSALQMLAMKRIVGYSHHQNQEGNRQMVRLALHRLRPEDVLHFPYSFPVLILCGDDDPLIPAKWGRQFVQEQMDLVNGHSHHDVSDTSNDTNNTDSMNIDNHHYSHAVPWIEYRTVSGANHNSILGGPNLTLVLESLHT